MGRCNDKGFYLCLPVIHDQADETYSFSLVFGHPETLRANPGQMLVEAKPRGVTADRGIMIDVPMMLRQFYP